MHWTLLFITAVFLLQAFLSMGVTGLWMVAVTQVILLFSILFHELAHCWMAVRRGAGAEQIVLWPLGGMAYVGHTGSSHDEIKIAAAGPASSFLLSGIFFGTVALSASFWRWEYLNPFDSWWYPDLTIPQVFALHGGRINLILGLFNLCLPAYPLDGGRILFGFLSIRHGRTRAAEITSNFAIVIGLAVLLWGFVQGAIFLAFIGGFVLLEAWQLKRLARLGALGAHPMVGASHGYENMYEPQWREKKPKKPGFFARRRAEKARKRAEKEARRAEELQDRVDEILEKINREGMQSLTPAERRILDEASKRTRGE